MEDKNKQVIRNIAFNDALGDRYVSYAMSTIMSRSLPDVRDGLKPVHRRLLYAMLELKMNPETGFKKCARVVGDVIGKFHPHGDQAVYDAMVRLAQEFSVRYPLVDGQGNFGSIDGDRAAAMRYTEAKLTNIASLMLDNIDKDTVDFVSTYDGEYIEPLVLPTLFPNLLANGASGIAVGMATNIPSHNIIEILDALKHLLKSPNASINSLLKYIKGPDLPTGGCIIDTYDVIKKCYETGKGSFRLRSKWKTENKSRGQYEIIVYEIPWSVTKTRVIEKLEELVSSKKVASLLDVIDESTDEIRIKIIPRTRDVKADHLMYKLFSLTDLEIKISLNMNVLDSSNFPRVMNIKEVLLEFISHRQTVLKRFSKNRLKVATNRKEILDGYLIVYDNLDEIIEIIRNEDDPKSIIMKKWKLNENQAESILNLRLRFLKRLEENAIIEEKKNIVNEIKSLKELLNSDEKQKAKINEEIKTLKTFFIKDNSISNRRTTIDFKPIESFELEEDEIISEPCTIALSQNNWIQIIKGHEKDSSLKYKEGDAENFIIKGNNNDKFLLCSSLGRVFTISPINLSIAKGFGSPIRMFLELGAEEIIVSIMKYKDNKKVLISSYQNKGFIIPSMKNILGLTKLGKQVFSLNKDDKVQVFRIIEDFHDHIAVIGENHKLLVFNLNELSVQTKGKGTILQKVKQGGLSDAISFNLNEGIECRINNTRKTFKDIKLWLGKRAQSGRLAPRGFPRSNKFN